MVMRVWASCGAQRADHELGIGVDSHRYAAAANAAADDEWAVVGDFEPAACMGARQWTAGADDRSPVAECDLASVSVAGEANIELFIVEQQEAVRRVGEEDSNRVGVRECPGDVGMPGPRVIDSADGNAIEGRREREALIDEHFDTSGGELARDVRVVAPQVMIAQHCVFTQRGIAPRKGFDEYIHVPCLP